MTNIDDARLALALAKSEPASALRRARALLDLEQANGTDTPSQIEIVARWAAGTALYEMGRNDESVVELDQAVAAAAGTQAARIEVSLAAALVGAGESRDGKDRLNRLRANEDPVIAALAVSQLGTTALHAGDLPRAQQLFLQAIPALQAAAEHNALARVVGNIGHCLVLREQIEESIAYTRSALQLAESCGETTIVAGSLQNLGYAEMRLGNLPAAIELLERAHEVYEAMGATGRNMATLYDDLAETYRFGGLTVEALRYAQLSLRLCQAGGNEEKLADATFRYAKCLLAARRPQQAIEVATTARNLFLRSERVVQAHRTSLFVIEAEAETGVETAIAPAESVNAAALELAEAGWHAEALAFRTQCVHRSQRSDPELAAVLLAQASKVDLETPAAQLENYYRDALSANPETSQRALDGAHEELRGRLGRVRDAELRAGASGSADRFRRLELDRAFVVASPVGVLRVHERWRSLSRSSAAVRSVPAAVLEATEELRGLLSRRQTRGTDNSVLVDIGRVEEKITRLSRAQTVVADAPSTLDLDALPSELGEQLMVVFIPFGGDLFAIEIGAGRPARLRPCGELRTITGLARQMRRSLGQLLGHGASDRIRRTLRGALQADAQKLRALLFGDLTMPDEPVDLLITPPPALLDMSWSLICEPFASSVAVVESPSAYRRTECHIGADDVSVLCGPDLRHTNEDIAAVKGMFPACTIGRNATAEQLTSALVSSALVHICAHGTFRADAPRFSSLRMTDGPIMVHELDQLVTAPQVVVMGSCEAGRAEGFLSADGLGAASALLAVGADCVVAPVHAVPDESTAELFQLFYAELRDNTPAQALAACRQARHDEAPLLWATSHTMQCVGNSSPIVRFDASNNLEKCERDLDPPSMPNSRNER